MIDIGKDFWLQPALGSNCSHQDLSHTGSKSFNAPPIPYRDLPSPIGYFVDLPASVLGNRVSWYCKTRNTVSRANQNTRPQAPWWSMVNSSGYRHSRCQPSEFSNPEHRGPDSLMWSHLYSALSLGSHATTSPRNFTDRESTVRVFSGVENPERRILDLSGSRATCPFSNRQFPLNREIATCDFKG